MNEIAVELYNCHEAMKMADTIDELYDFIVNYDAISTKAKEIVATVSTYYRNELLNENANNESRYLQAKYITEAITLVTPIAVAKVGKLATFEKILAEINSIENNFKFIARLISRLKGKIFRVGDKIAETLVRQVRNGTSNKVVIIGRQMPNHVLKVAQELKDQGRYVEVLDDDYLKPLYDAGLEFIIDGKKWTVNSAWDDMKNNPAWDLYRDDRGYIKLEHLDKTPMYKLNRIWIQKARADGATIIDMGYPSGHDMSISGFYEMEKSTITWD